MLKPEQVPKECLVAYQRAFKAGGGPADGIAAAINAWPGMQHVFMLPHRRAVSYSNPAFILPLPQENTDGK